MGFLLLTWFTCHPLWSLHWEHCLLVRKKHEHKVIIQPESCGLKRRNYIVKLDSRDLEMVHLIHRFCYLLLTISPAPSRPPPLWTSDLQICLFYFKLDWLSCYFSKIFCCNFVVFHLLSWLAARVITDRDSGRSRGFGFVNFSSDESASSALSAMDGQVSIVLRKYVTCLSHNHCDFSHVSLFRSFMDGVSV